MGKSTANVDKLEAIGTQIAQLSERSASADKTLQDVVSRLGRVESSVTGLTEQIGHVKGGASTLKTVLTIFGVLLVTGLSGTAIFAGRSVIKEVAREVVREELQYRSTIVQQGKFAAPTRIAGDEVAFAWGLKVPVDPDKVIFIAAETLEQLPGIAISAQRSAPTESSA